MKKEWLFLLVLSCLITGLSTGHAIAALTYEFNMGSGSDIETTGTNDVLQMDVLHMNPDLDDISFTLEVGQSETFWFATIGTSESWINRDDMNPGTVNALIDFDNPNLTQSIRGTSDGSSQLMHFFQGWELSWDDPMQVVSNSGLDFSVELSDARFVNWLWQGPDGVADIYATVTLNAVPIPATLVLLGTGLIGLGTIRKKIPN